MNRGLVSSFRCRVSRERFTCYRWSLVHESRNRPGSPETGNLKLETYYRVLAADPDGGVTSACAD